MSDNKDEVLNFEDICKNFDEENSDIQNDDYIDEEIEFSPDQERKMILAIVGVSGSGKSFLERNLIETYPDYFNKWEQMTTRSPRIGELEKKPYVFVTPETFNNFGPLLVGRVGYGTEQEYGCSYGSIPNFEPNKISTVILNMEGLLDLKKIITNDHPEWELCVLGLEVDNNQLEVQREGRDEEFLNKEKDVLNLADYRRSRTNGKYIVPNDVVKIVNEWFLIDLEMKD